MFSFLGLILVRFFEKDGYNNNNNIINIAWANEINGTDNSDNLT